MSSADLAESLPDSPTDERGISSHYDNFKALKQEVARLIEENKRLEAEYSSLKSNYDDLQMQIDQHRQRMAGREELYRGKVRERKSREDILRNLRSELEKTQDDVRAVESGKTHLSGRLTGADEQTSLWQIKLAELENRKNELEIELKYKEYLLEDAQHGTEETVDRNKTKLQEMLQREHALERHISELHFQIEAAPSRIQELGQRIEETKAEVAGLEKKNDFEARVNTNLNNKKQYVAKIVEDSLQQAETQKRRLQDSLKQMEGEYAALDVKVSGFLSMKNEKQKLVQEVINVDKANQILRSRITDFQGRVSVLKK